MHSDKFHFILTILFVLQVRAPGEDSPRRFPLAGWTRTTLTVLAVLILLLGVIGVCEIVKTRGITNTA